MTEYSELPKASDDEVVEYWINLDHPCYGADVWAIDSNSPMYPEYRRAAQGQGYVLLDDVRAAWNRSEGG